MVPVNRMNRADASISRPVRRKTGTVPCWEINRIAQSSIAGYCQGTTERKPLRTGRMLI